jgi:hypothetical protein
MVNTPLFPMEPWPLPHDFLWNANRKDIYLHD